MAVLVPPNARVETSAGAPSPTPINGGKLRVYNVNTTTLSSTYSDEALATPLTNPVEADANGMLPNIFAAAGTYDIAYLDASNNVLSGQSYNDYPTVGGSTASTFLQEVSGARVKIDGGDIGDGNTGVRYNAGNPSPDDTGGYARFGGWAGTRGDGAEFDFTSANFDAEKSLKEGGKRITEVLYTDATTFSAASTVDIALPNTPTGTREWIVDVYDLAGSAGDFLAGRFSYDSGATYKSGASDYAFNVEYNNAGTAAWSTDDAHTMIRLVVNGVMNISGWLTRLSLRITTPDSGTGNTLIHGTAAGGRTDLGASTYVPSNEIITGVGLGGYGRATHFRLLPLTGTPTFSGKYRVRTIRGTGE